MRRLARFLFWLALAVIVVATLGPIDLRPETGEPPQLERFGAFLVVSGLLSVAYPRQRAIGWVLLAAVAGLLELLQNVVPGRHGRVVDFDAKVLGVVVGAGMAITVEYAGRYARRQPSKR